MRFYNRTLAQPSRPPIGSRALLHVPCGLGGGLQPRPFWGPSFSANKLLHTSWRMGASDPTFLLSKKLDALPMTLSPHLGTLAAIRVVSLAPLTLTASKPSPGVYGECSFGV